MKAENLFAECDLISESNKIFWEFKQPSEDQLAVALEFPDRQRYQVTDVRIFTIIPIMRMYHEILLQQSMFTFIQSAA